MFWQAYLKIINWLAFTVSVVFLWMEQNVFVCIIIPACNLASQHSAGLFAFSLWYNLVSCSPLAFPLPNERPYSTGTGFPAFGLKHLHSWVTEAYGSLSLSQTGKLLPDREVESWRESYGRNVHFKLFNWFVVSFVSYWKYKKWAHDYVHENTILENNQSFGW